MEDSSHHGDFPDEISRPYSPHDEALDFPHPDEDADAETQLTQDCGYNSSASSTDPSSGDIIGADYEDDELPGLNSRASSRSSVSSLPGSVFTHSMAGAKAIARDAQESAIFWDDRYTKGHQGRGEPGLKSLQALRQRESAFRKPSSVRALQMHTEDEGDEEYLTPPRRRGGHRMSDISMRSSHSSPLKRSPYYSPAGSASKQKVKKEYPLVLLHCTLLPPSLPIPGLAGPPDSKVLKEVLPSEYWRRWKLLEEKVGSGVLRDRGVLISHPEDMYDLLEDRLLESLELQHPRLDHGHFVGHEEGDSEEDQANKEESETDGEQGEDCPDCGGRFLKNNHSRKWEIKVFAANGLMRAGAWAAAWKEMEKVDVEVGLWLPSELRRDLEKRLRDSEMSTALTRMEIPQLIEPRTMTEPESQPSLPQPSPSLSTVMPVLFTPERASSPIPPPSPTPAPRQQHRPAPSHSPNYPPKPEVEIDLHTLLVNYIRVLANDRRNVAIVVLSILVVLFAIDYRPRALISDLRPFPQEDMLSSTSVPSMQVSPVKGSSADWATPNHPEIPAQIVSTSSVAAESSVSYQPSSANDASAPTSATAVHAAEIHETTEAKGMKLSEDIKPSEEIERTDSVAIDPPKSQPLAPNDDDIHPESEKKKTSGAETEREEPAPIVAPAEKQIDLQLDDRVEPSLDVLETTLNDTPLESQIEVQKTHDEAPNEVHDSEKPLIITQTAAKEQQALIATT